MSVQVDHVVQVWKDGGDELDNLRLAHRICNMKRQAEELSPAQRLRDEKAREGRYTLKGEISSEEAATRRARSS
jgi:5-methylcytosine-specific restriction endonuclease McrA